MAIWEVSSDEETVEGLDVNGRPDPAYAAALGLVPAHLGRRAVAFTIDIIGYLLLQIPYWLFTLPLLLMLYLGQISLYGLVNHPDFILAIVMGSISFVLSLAYCLVQLVIHGRRGATIGKTFMGYRGINVKTLEKPGFWRMALRFLVLYASSLVVIGPIIFLISPFFDPEKRGRGWHDMVGKVWYVDIRQGLNPYDEKRMRIARKMVTTAPVARQKEMPSLATPSQRGASEEYRPGGRVSAGVLGVARPHGAGGRPEVGLVGTEEVPEASPEESAGTDGLPALGAYRARTQHHESSDRGARAEYPGTFGQQEPTAQAPSVGPPSGTRAGQAPQRSDGASGPPAPESGGVVTGTPWSAPPRAGAGQPQQQPPEQRVPARPQQPSPQQPPQAPQQASPPQTYALLLDTGESVPVTEPVLIGRNPSSETARSIPISDESRSISKTHMLLRPTEGGVEVTDQRSTNGSAVVHEGVQRTCVAGEAIPAVAGDTIRFGERTAVVVAS